MSLEDSKLLDNKPFSNSIVKRDFSKVCHQQEANLNDPVQNVESIFGENDNYQQIGNAYLEFDITVLTNDIADFGDNTAFRLVRNSYAYAFKECRLITTSASDLENNKFVGHVSTIIRCK